MHRLCPLPRTEASTAATPAAVAVAVACTETRWSLLGRVLLKVMFTRLKSRCPSSTPRGCFNGPGIQWIPLYSCCVCSRGGHILVCEEFSGLHVLTGISSRARPLAHTRGVRPAVYLLCACCLREMASLVLRVDVRVYTCSKTRNGCWPWPEGVTLAPPKSTWEQPHPGKSRDLKTWVLEMKPGNCTKPGFSTRFSMLRMDPKSPDSGRA